MIKIISMMKRREGLSIEEFRQWALHQHSQLGAQFPKIRHYRMSVVLPDHADGPYDAVSELYFDTLEDFQAALAADIGAQAGADIKAHCAAERFRLVTEEKIIVE
ncbi:MAG: EthD family reductase [Anaerolineae bacterium]|nr:EthD family reductase [Anaerolineae bacterium]